MQLELKHLASYLPYGIKLKFIDSDDIFGITYDEHADYANNLYPLSVLAYTIEKQNESKISWQLLLRPISSLTKPITHNGETFVPLEYISTSEAVSQRIMRRVFNEQSLDNLEYWQFERLLELHFDVFSLIPQNLAINLETIDKQ